LAAENAETSGGAGLAAPYIQFIYLIITAAAFVRVNALRVPSLTRFSAFSAANV
jgi:hypothetical protein